MNPRPTDANLVPLLPLRNLLRRRIRTTLTVLGVGVGVATVVALISVSRGMRAQFDVFFEAGDAQLVAMRRGITDPFLSYLSSELVGEVAAADGVAAAHPFFWSLLQVPRQPFFLVYGVTEGSPFFQEVRFVAGVDPTASDAERPVALGDVIAEYLELDPGDPLELSGETFTVVGVYEATVPLYSGGSLLRLEDARRLTSLEGKVSSILIEPARPDGIDSLALALEEAFPELRVSRPSDLTDTFDEFEFNDQALFVFSLLAVVVGGIAVMNTMLMSVFERTREIGVLQAVGWSRGLIMRQVLVEGVLVCLAGGAAGIVLGIAGVEAIGSSGKLSWVAGQYGADVFVKALVVAVGMGAIGSAYPAYRATRITPIAALRYE